jgi:fatty-acyl-CoA synthase
VGFDLVDVTAKRAELCPERFAFVDSASGRTLTYRAFDGRAARLAGVFASHGAEREDRVAILCRNRIEFFEALFACAKLGAILVPLNWRMPASELAPIVADCEPKLILFGREDEAVARELAGGDRALIGLDENYQDLIRASSPMVTPRLWPGDSIWTLIYTSGTTGQPKGVLQTVQMALVNYLHAAQAFGVREGDRTLNFLPLFHTAGIQLLTLPALIAGGTATILPAFDADRVLNLLAETDVFFAVPTVYQQLSLAPGFDDADLSCVRAWGCGGAALPDILAERFAAKGVRVQNGYGMTETGPTAFVAAPEDALRKIGAVGKPQFLLDVRLVAQGRDVAPGETGEIWMRGPGITPGYWKRPEATARALTPDGWLKSGDLGRRDNDGAMHIVGRSKEMYISGAENIYPAEIENVLARHPAVLEAAVVGVPDEQWGEVGRAYVQLRPGAHAPPAAEFEQFCRAALAAYKVPKTFVFVEDMPRTAAGKVRKHLLTAAP